MMKKMLVAKGDFGSPLEGNKVLKDYSDRHRVQSAAILTVFDDQTAARTVAYLEPRIRGKTVIEIGGGTGLLSLHMGTIAKRVYCIEANPVWSSLFITSLLINKPRNVSYLFGTADEFLGQIKGDVAIICSHSGLRAMKSVAAQFAPIVIDVYGEFDTSGIGDREQPWCPAASDGWRRSPCGPRPMNDATNEGVIKR